MGNNMVSNDHLFFLIIVIFFLNTGRDFFWKKAVRLKLFNRMAELESALIDSLTAEDEKGGNND